MAAPKSDEPKLLWNPDNVKDVAESLGISQLGDDALRSLSQDVEYRIGQVIIEALRHMRAGNRTILTVQDMSQALKVLDVEPLYGYESTRPLRYGEASLGPGQPLFYIEDEEVDFEKLINAPLPKVPRDSNFTGKPPRAARPPVSRPSWLTARLHSALARNRGRATLNPPKPDDGRGARPGAPAKGTRSERGARGAGGQR